jgi:hypothetical protein
VHKKGPLIASGPSKLNPYNGLVNAGLTKFFFSVQTTFL